MTKIVARWGFELWYLPPMFFLCHHLSALWATLQKTQEYKAGHKIQWHFHLCKAMPPGFSSPCLGCLSPRNPFCCPIKESIQV
jgi:hypothetical protein